MATFSNKCLMIKTLQKQRKKDFDLALKLEETKKGKLPKQTTAEKKLQYKIEGITKVGCKCIVLD